MITKEQHSWFRLLALLTGKLTRTEIQILDSLPPLDLSTRPEWK